MCGIFNSGSLGRIAATSPAIQFSPAVDFIFETARRQQLHADADSEEWTAARAHRFLERLDHAGDRVEAAPAIGERADAGQHDMIGARHRLGTRRHRHRAIEPGLPRGALERFVGRVQIARPVVDDGDVHLTLPLPGTGR